jgi:YD repeat-containing protein
LFDLNSNLTTVTDANGNITSTIYQSNSNRVAATVDSNAIRVSFVYEMYPFGAHR